MFRLLLISLLLVATPAGTQERPIVRVMLVGDLLDPRLALERFVERRLLGTPWGEETMKALSRLFLLLHYDVVVESRDAPTEGIHLTLSLTPHTVIRRIEVPSGKAPASREDILSRLTLRPGSRIPTDPAERSARLHEEELRIREHLVKEGYFDAKVQLSTEPRGPYEIVLRVGLDKGAEYKVGAVKVQGNVWQGNAATREEASALLDEEIAQRFEQRWFFGFWKERFTRDRLKRDIEELEKIYHRFGFPRVRVTSDFDPAMSPNRESKTVDLTITIREGKQIDVFFEGNKSISSDKLKTGLTFASERSYDDYAVESSAESIRRIYQAEGYFQASITYERVKLHQTLDRIIFRVDEGPRLPVRSIRFVGNRAFSPGELLSQIRTRVLPVVILRSIQSGGYLTTLQLEQDRQALESFYRGQGFSRAKVFTQVATDTRLLGHLGAIVGALAAGHRTGLHVEFRIEEGERDTVDRVVVRDGHAIPLEEVTRTLELEPQKTLTLEALKEDHERLGELYSNRGFLLTEIQTRCEEDDGRTTVIHEIQENEKVHTGEIFLRGNFKTKSAVIRRALGLRSGDELTHFRLGRARSSLEEMRLFSSISFDLLGAEEKRGPIDLLVTVREAHDNHGEIELGGGLSTESGEWGLFGSGSYSLRNILGLGVGFSARGEWVLALDTLAQGGTDFLRQFVEVNLGLPALFVPFRVDVTGRLQTEEHDRFGELSSKEGRVTLSRRFFKHLLGSAGLSYRQYDRDEELVRPAGVYEEEEKAPVETTTGALTALMVYDRRQSQKNGEERLDPLSPTRGYRLSAAVSWASRAFLGTDDFVKLSLSGQLYLPLGKGDRFLLTNGIRYDQGIPLTGVLLPEEERFFAGGDNTVRGLEKDHLLTEEISSPIYPGSSIEEFRVLPAGGNIRAIHNLDLQINLYDTWLASAVFLDTGFVANTFTGFQPTDLRHGLGMAVRFTTPMGRLSVEWAIPLDPQRGDDPRGHISFNVGFVF